MIPIETVKEYYDRSIAYSRPPIFINKGLRSEQVYYPNKKLRKWCLENFSYEEIIFKVCNKNRELCNAVYDYAMSVGK